MDDFIIYLENFTKSDLYINRKYRSVHSDVINITSKYCDFGISEIIRTFFESSMKI